VCADVCPAGYLEISTLKGHCKKCPHNCVTCDASEKCLSCDESEAGGMK